MVHATFRSARSDRLACLLALSCNETGSTYTLYSDRCGRFDLFEDGTYLGNYPTRAEALTRAEQEARLQVASLISHNA